MDYTSELPERFWVLRPQNHQNKHTLTWCDECSADLDIESGICIPVFNNRPLCRSCALKVVEKSSPTTIEYMTWLEDGDPRWWSPWYCTCGGCTNEEAAEKHR